MAEVYTRACPAYGYGHGIIWGRLERPFFYELSKWWNFKPACGRQAQRTRRKYKRAQFNLSGPPAFTSKFAQRLNFDLIRNIVVKYSGYILIWFALQLNFSAEDAEGKLKKNISLEGRVPLVYQNF